jgi:hypothetical protein
VRDARDQASKLARLSGLFALVALLLVVLFALDLSRLVGSESLHRTLRANAAAALGGPVEWHSVDLGLWPPRIVLHSVALLAGEDEAARIAAESVELRLVPRSLLARRLEVGALGIQGLELVAGPAFLAGTAGIEGSPRSGQPGAGAATAARDGRPPLAGSVPPASESEDASPISLDVRHVSLEGGSLLLRVGGAGGTHAWHFEDLKGSARMDPAADRLDAQGRARLIPADSQVASASEGASLMWSATRMPEAGPGVVVSLDFAELGRLRLTGVASAGIREALELELEALDLALFASLVPEETLELEGRASGRGRLTGPLTAPERLTLELSIDEGALRLPGHSVEGPYEMQLEVDAPLSGRPRGSIALDLTAARLSYGERFEKQPGKPAEMVSRFAPDAQGELAFQTRIQLRNIDEVLR